MTHNADHKDMNWNDRALEEASVRDGWTEKDQKVDHRDENKL